MYSLPHVSVDDLGKVYLADRRYQKIRVFDPAGVLERLIGAPGQGPGGIGQVRGLAIADGVVVASDHSNARLSLWSLDGSFLRSVPLGEQPGIENLVSAQQRVFAEHVLNHDRGARRSHNFGELSLETGELRELVSVDLPVRQMKAPSGMQVSMLLPAAEPSFAVAPSGSIYVTAGNEYQVLALDAAGTVRWALHVPWPREQVPREIAERRRARALQNFGEAARDLPWPEKREALSHLSVDAEGRLYVFPYVYGAPETRPVDVYSADGEKLFSGKIPLRKWDIAAGDYVYGGHVDPGDREWRVSRWRLRFPD